MLNVNKAAAPKAALPHAPQAQAKAKVQSKPAFTGAPKAVKKSFTA